MRIYKCIFLLFFSCQSPKQLDIVPEYSLQHKILLDDNFVIGKVRSMVLMDDSIPIVVDIQSNKVFQVLDYRKQDVRNYGGWGQGPDEFLFPTALSVWKGHTVACWDMNKRRYSAIQLAPEDSVAQFRHLFETHDSLFHYEIFPVRNGQFIAAGIYQNYRLVVLDKEGCFTKGFGTCPYRNDEERNISGNIRSEVYQGKLAVNPSGTRLVHALLRADIFSFYDIASNGDLHLAAEHIRSYPDYQYDSGAMELSAPIYYLDVCATERYAYVLYSGKNYKAAKDKAFVGKIIKVYDWEGRHVRNLNLDIEIQNMCVSPDDGKIYAIAFQPNPILVSFDMDSIYPAKDGKQIVLNNK